MRTFLTLAAIAVAASALGGCWWGGPGWGHDHYHGGGGGPRDGWRGDVVVPHADRQA
jgi:hypothetical protein